MGRKRLSPAPTPLEMEHKRVADHEAALQLLCDCSRFGLEEITAEDVDARLARLATVYARDWQEFAKRAADAEATSRDILLELRATVAGPEITSPGDNRTLDEGIHFSVPPSVYHADPAPASSLSSGVARLLVQRSPMHAWNSHPRLGGRSKEPTKEMEEGTLLHALILGTEQAYVAVDADDWKGKVAKERRIEARATGAIPVLRWRLAELERCAKAFAQQIARHECADALTDGHPEATLIWRDGTVWCRARPDWLPKDRRRPLVHLKTTSGSAAPDKWERHLWDDYAIEAAFYLRGARALGLEPAGAVFLVIETDAPYGLCAFQPDPVLLGVADEQVEEALQLWESCTRTGAWPGYPARICHVTPPDWQLRQLEDRKIRMEWERKQKPSPDKIEQWNRFMQAGVPA